MAARAEIFAPKILIVDDQPDHACLMQAMLEGCGYTDIVSTCDPHAAVASCGQRRTDLVILDLIMPGMDGFAVMDRLRSLEAGGNPTVLAVTADPGLMERALQAGARDFISKPLKLAEVRARVNNLLQERMLMSELERILEQRTARMRDSEALFRLFATHLPEGIFIRGADDRIYRYLNPALAKIIGRKLAVGDHVDVALDAMHLEDREAMRRDMARFPAGGIDREVRYVHADGSVRWGHVRTFPMAEEGQERIPWVAGIVEDVTERKVAESALRESESRFRALVEQSIVAIYLVKNGRFVYANPRMCEMMGCTPEELHGTETVDLVVEEDRAKLLENRRRSRAGEAGALIATYRLRRKDGRILHLAVDGRMLVLDGRQVLFGIGQDITERVHAEELLREAGTHYRALVEQSLVGIYILGKGGRIMYSNPKLCHLLGFSGDELSRRTPRNLVIEEDHGVVDEVESRRRTGETGSIAVGCRVRRSDGRVVHLSVESKVIELGGRKAVIGIVQDITERARTAEALENANQRLQVLSERVLAVQEEERRIISRDLHDDVGQSLLALKIALHRLKEHVGAGGSPLLSESIEVTESVQERLHELSVELRPPHLEQLGLPDALRWLVNRQREMTGLAIRCRCRMWRARPRSEIEIACYRICQEALNNAVRHARATVISVELDAADGALTLAIADDGAGFDEKSRRGPPLTSSSLGLITMEERARLAGGRLELRTHPGAGTCIKATFPIAFDEPHAEAAGTLDRST